MELDTKQLAEIGTAVEALDAAGLSVKMVEVVGHDVYLKKVDSKHHIVGITNKVRNPQEGTLR
jgi:hypothetical protein